jgi:hypothetical protein
MNAMEKYLFEMRMAFLADDEPTSGADLAAVLGTSGEVDGRVRNPTSFAPAEMAGLLGSIIQRARVETMTLAGLTGLDGQRIAMEYDAVADFTHCDPVRTLRLLLEKELGQRGPVARSLTRWLLEHSFAFAEMAEANSWSRERLAEEIASKLAGSNAEYASAVRQYFEPEREAVNTENRLQACCTLFGLDYESVAEKAGTLEFDAGMGHTTAAIHAFWYAIGCRHPTTSLATAAAVFDLSLDALDAKQASGWSMAETIAWLMKRLDRPCGTAPDRVAI